jgi:TPR repeat protein
MSIECKEGFSYDELTKGREDESRLGNFDGISSLDEDIVVQDYKDIINWYKLAAELGNVVRQSNLGVMYYRGQGVTQNYKEAIKWFRLAAEQGNSEAQYNLGRIYR